MKRAGFAFVCFARVTPHINPPRDNPKLIHSCCSDIRQVPDHQEVFLSPNTLTSIIFEINDYVEPGDENDENNDNVHPTTTTTTTTLPNGTTTTTTTTAVNGNGNATAASSPETDAAAARYHFTDVVSPPDTLAGPLPEPQRVTLPNPSLAAYPAFVLSANIVSQEPPRRRNQPQAISQQPSASSSSSSQASAASTSSSRSSLESLVHQIQLLIRLREYDTDICVRVNVPLKEFAGNDSQVAAEAAFARDMLSRVVSTLQVLDFGLLEAEA